MNGKAGTMKPFNADQVGVRWHSIVSGAVRGSCLFNERSALTQGPLCMVYHGLIPDDISLVYE